MGRVLLFNLNLIFWLTVFAVVWRRESSGGRDVMLGAAVAALIVSAIADHVVTRAYLRERRRKKRQAG